MDPADTETEIRSIRKTRAGGVLLELGAATKNKEAFREQVKEVLGEQATVSCLEPKTSIEIRDLDGAADTTEVEEALRKTIPNLGEVRIGVTRPNTRGEKAAIVDMAEKHARQLLQIGKIKVGWMFCRVRRRVKMVRCFRCLGYGHIAGSCKGPDRRDHCYKCGVAGHKARDCGSATKCVLCAERGMDRKELDHIPGSGRCRVFRECLEKKRTGPK